MVLQARESTSSSLPYLHDHGGGMLAGLMFQRLWIAMNTSRTRLPFREMTTVKLYCSSCEAGEDCPRRWLLRDADRCLVKHNSAETIPRYPLRAIFASGTGYRRVIFSRHRSIPWPIYASRSHPEDKQTKMRMCSYYLMLPRAEDENLLDGCTAIRTNSD